MTTLEENSGPVNDPTTDYNIFDPEFVRDPYPTMTEIRESGCPIAHSNRWGGSWFPTRYEDVVAIAQEHEIFTSRDIIVVPRSAAQAEGPYAGVAAPPITSDPPDHHWHRRLILPIFSPQSVAKYEQGTRDLCNKLIDGFIAKGEADAGTDYAQQIPVRVIATMLGVPTEMADEFTGWVRGVLEVGLTDPKVRLESRLKILNFFRQQLDDRRANPREDDLITDLLNSGDKYPVTDQYVLGVCNLMLVAGID
ncbi:MAG: cytochrome P450, partial [Ilumatobacteraceae bacterium]